MKTKRSKRFLKLDYTTAVVVGAISLVVCSLGIVATNYITTNQRNQNDHKRPLEITNLSYCNGEKLDLTVPQSSTPVPLVIYIHGGGWQYGSKVGGTVSLAKPLIQNDIAVASINYRLSGSAKFSAQIQDVFCAVRYLRKNATLYNLNPEKVGVIGISAGANLSILAANSSKQPEFISGSNENESNEVQAAVGINGIYDLNASSFNKTTEANIQKLTAGDSGLRSRASPSQYVTKNDPPQLLIYSQKDGQVFPSQTTDYYKLATNSGIKTQLLQVGDAGHNLEPYFRFSTKPSRDSIEKTISTFFVEQLLTQ